MRSLTLKSSKKVEVCIQSGWLKCQVSEYHSGINTMPFLQYSFIFQHKEGTKVVYDQPKMVQGTQLYTGCYNYNGHHITSLGQDRLYYPEPRGICQFQPRQGQFLIVKVFFYLLSTRFFIADDLNLFLDLSIFFCKIKLNGGIERSHNSSVVEGFPLSVNFLARSPLPVIL